MRRLSVVAEHYRIQAGKVECETIDDEVIIIQFDTGNYYTLSGLGAFIWHVLDFQPTFSEILPHINAHYETETNAQFPAEIQSFLDELVGENLIERITNPQASSSADQDTPATRLRYETPVLERYSDMQALLVLDPIHEVDPQGWPHIAGDSK
jgi:hypothetical protein